MWAFTACVWERFKHFWIFIVDMSLECRVAYEQRDIAAQKTSMLIITEVKISNLEYVIIFLVGLFTRPRKPRLRPLGIRRTDHATPPLSAA
jgi:hypothetical protein